MRKLTFVLAVVVVLVERGSLSRRASTEVARRPPQR